MTEEKYELAWDGIIRYCDKLVGELQDTNYKSIYGVPTGANNFIALIAATMNLSIAEEHEINEHTLIVDDLVDSGRTMEKYRRDYPMSDFATLFVKPKSPRPKYFAQEVGEGWVCFPWEGTKEAGITDNIVRIFEYIGEDPNREGLIDTPKRIAKMYKELFRGYDDKQKPKVTSFENGKDGLVYDEMIVDTGDFYSHCEHHMVPFFGQYYFAYIPNKRILGLSKVARIIDHFSAKLQIQERLVKEVLDEIEKELQPLGIALVMKGEHLCKTMRGVKKKGQMVTSDLRGFFKDDPRARGEFMSLINGFK